MNRWCSSVWHVCIESLVNLLGNTCRNKPHREKKLWTRLWKCPCPLCLRQNNLCSGAFDLITHCLWEDGAAEMLTNCRCWMFSTHLKLHCLKCCHSCIQSLIMQMWCVTASGTLSWPVPVTPSGRSVLWRSAKTGSLNPGINFQSASSTS